MAEVVNFLVVFGEAKGPLPETGEEGEFCEAQSLPRKGELMRLDGKFWKVEELIHWEFYFPTVVLVPYRKSGLRNAASVDLSSGSGRP